MERRSFLALLASAPIAALAPLPKILAQHCYLSDITDQFSFDTSACRQTVTSTERPGEVLILSGGRGYRYAYWRPDWEVWVQGPDT